MVVVGVQCSLNLKNLQESWDRTSDFLLTENLQNFKQIRGPRNIHHHRPERAPGPIFNMKSYTKSVTRARPGRWCCTFFGSVRTIMPKRKREHAQNHIRSTSLQAEGHVGATSQTKESDLTCHAGLDTQPCNKNFPPFHPLLQVSDTALSSSRRKHIRGHS